MPLKTRLFCAGEHPGVPRHTGFVLAFLSTSTVRAAVKTLKAVGRQCDILNPGKSKDYLSKAKYGENRRDKILGDVDYSSAMSMILASYQSMAFV